MLPSMRRISGSDDLNVKQNMSVLKTAKFKCNVSSVLNRDAKQYGKSFLFDSREDTCWNSDQGAPQWIVLQFEEPQKVASFEFQFQGGFAGKECTVKIEDWKGTFVCEEPFYPDDINARQKFLLSQPVDNAFKVIFTFHSSTDFFGRIIVYGFDILQ